MARQILPKLGDTPPSLGPRYRSWKPGPVPAEGDPKEALRIIASRVFNEGALLVEFSDGTSAFFTAKQLIKLSSTRMQTGTWPDRA